MSPQAHEGLLAVYRFAETRNPFWIRTKTKKFRASCASVTLTDYVGGGSPACITLVVAGWPLLCCVNGVGVAPTGDTDLQSALGPGPTVQSGGEADG